MIVKDYRNPSFSAEGVNQVDLEIETDLYGWIPTTIVIDDGDQEPHTIQIKEWINKNIDLVSAYIAPEPPPPPSENEIADINRIAEYPAIQDQLDMIYHDLEDGTKLWQDKIRAIKTKYPKV